MASEDVIELGSSDDEVEPAPKRKKSIPNVMVHIPTNLPGLTIKPTTSRGAGISKRTCTVTKVESKPVNPNLNINKLNGKALQKPVNMKVIAIPSSNSITKHTPNTTQGINPISLFKKINSQVVINKVSSNKITKPLLRINSPKSINNIPSSITVKSSQGKTRPVFQPKPIKNMRHIISMKHTPLGIKVVNKKQQNARPGIKVSNEVLTVDLDDDDTEASTSSPQWYLRPEDEDKPTQEEEENNKEPDQGKLVEITIEDSPVKPKPLKAVEDFSVTIEDSPVKAIAEKNTEPKSTEEGVIETKCKTPQSKKRLEYPNEDHEKKVVEIEIEPITVNIDSANVDTLQAKLKNNEDGNRSSEIVIEIEESPLKETHKSMTSTPKKNQNRPPVKFPEEIKCESSSDNTEFHPVYQNFIKLCFELENSEDMQKIVEKKVKTYYRQVPQEYTESEQFVDMVTSKIHAMKASPDKMYLFIKDIVDELNLQRKMVKSMPIKSDNEKVALAESENFLYGENSEFDSKRQRQIRKLEKTLKKLHRAIQKLEEQEVDFDDEEDSVYLLTERYKERMMRVHAKFCQLTNTKMPSEPRVQLEPRQGHPPGPAKRLEKWINKKVPIGTPLPFPDFHDVLRCVKEANEEDKLGWNDVDIMEEARDLFTRCGRKLQRRRQENEWRTAVSRISLDCDPAENNEELRKKLELNKQEASKKEVEVFNKFADKQNQLKLEAEEIGDKEAEESPAESEEEIVDEESLENKDKRKERLKRLLQEKSKKSSDEKENEPTETSSNFQMSEEIKETMTAKDVEIKSAEGDDKQNKDNNIEERAPEVVKNDSEKNNQGSKIDETNKVESDIDELHLLQKLYSESEINTSTLDSSDSEAPISISDTLDSDSADKKSVISIENSSYSESEINKNESFETDMEKGALDAKNSEAIPNTVIIKEAIDTNIEIECSESGIQKKHVQSNNDEYNESVEDILLASSDDESTGNDNPSNEDNILSSDSPGSVERTGIVENPRSIEGTVNLKDDNLSIGETVVGDENLEQNALNSPSDKSCAPECSYLNEKVTDKTGSLNIISMEVVNEVSEDVISIDVDIPMQTDEIVYEKDCDDGIKDRVIVTHPSSNEKVEEYVSLDDDLLAGEPAKDNINKCECNSMSQELDKPCEGDPRFKETNQGEMSCSSNNGNDVNYTTSKKKEIIDESMIVDDDLESNLQCETGKDNVDGFLKESKVAEGLSTIKTFI